MIRATRVSLIVVVFFAVLGVYPSQAQDDAELLHQWATSAVASSQFGDLNWSASQATGEPNTSTCGDQGTAWASAKSIDKADITLRYEQAVIPNQINIHQTYSPGSIIRVELINAETNEPIVLPDSADSPGNTACPGVFTLDVTGTLPAVNAVKIYLDQSKIGKWDEIDAVELNGKPVRLNVVRQWATSAVASSQFGNSTWNAGQATGEPNTLACGDHGTAWASATPSELANITLRFVEAVIPTQINIHQTYSPGSIIRVELIDAETSKSIKLPNSADPLGNTACPGVFTLEIADTLPAVNAVTIYLDQSKIGKWNEIDAVELVGKPAKPDEVRQWAITAVASSQYGSSTWSASQAAGKPNTSTCSDQGTAWASAVPNEAANLTLRYGQAVIPTQINIYQTYSPGSIIRVELIDAKTKKPVKLPNSADPLGNTACPGVFTLEIADTLPAVNAVTIYLDQSKIGKWNEIDAVELVGKPVE